MDVDLLATRQDDDGVITVNIPPISPGGVAMITISIVMSIFAVTCTLMRMWVRKHNKVSMFMLEDILCYLACLFFLGLAFVYILLASIGGLGYHLGSLMTFHVERFSKAIFAVQVLYALTVGFVKLSITWMFERIFSGSPTVRHAAIAIKILTVIWMLQTILTGVLLCQPITLNWDASAHGHCDNSQVAFSAVAVLDLVTDSLILALPMRIVFGLSIDLSHKIAIASIFGAGIATIAITALRLYYVYRIDFNDITFSTVPSNIAATVQAGIAVMVATGPLLRPVFDRIIGCWLNLTSVSNNACEPSTSKSRHLSTPGHVNGFGTVDGSQTQIFEPLTDGEEGPWWELSDMIVNSHMSPQAKAIAHTRRVVPFESGMDDILAPGDSRPRVSRLKNVER